MELKTAVILEVKRNDFIFRMELPIGAPLGDTYEAGWEFLKKINDLSAEAVEKAKPQNDKTGEQDE
jgi:hypothetical protein